MPHICLARNDIPNGSVQILDLSPNSSQPQPRTASGQTKYVNRTILGDALSVTGGAAFSPTQAGYLANTTNTVTTTEDISGLTALLLDTTQPCNNVPSTARIRFLNVPVAGNTVVLRTAAGTYTLTAVVGAAGADEFTIGVSVSVSATNLAAALEDPANQATCDAAIGFHFSAVAVSDSVDLASVTVVGVDSSAGLTTNAAANIAFLFGGSTNNATYITTRTRRTAEAWNVNTVTRATAAIQAAIDAGSAVTDTALGTLLSSTVATSGVSAANPAMFTTSTAHGLTTGDSVLITGCAGASAANVNLKNWIVTVASATTFSIDYNNGGGGVTAAAATVNLAPSTSLLVAGQLGTMVNLLRVLSGAGYTLPSGTVLYAPLSIGAVNTQSFHAAVAGSFVEDVTATPEGGYHWQTEAAAIPVFLPIAPIRATQTGAAFNLSITQGTLAQLAAGPTWNLHTRSFMNGEQGLSGRALAADGTPIRSYAYQGNRANLRNGFAEANPAGLTSLSGIRLVTVYDDEGNVLV